MLLFRAHEAWHFYLLAVLFGIGFGGEMSAFPIINRQYYGNAPTSTVYGWQMFGSGIGMASGSFLGGMLRDLTGDYSIALGCSFVLSMMGTIASWSCLPPPATRYRSGKKLCRQRAARLRLPLPRQTREGMVWGVCLWSREPRCCDALQWSHILSDVETARWQQSLNPAFAEMFSSGLCY